MHDPQCSTSGASLGSSSVVNTAPRKNQLPSARDSRLVCLPCQPIPAACASGFSITGAVSTNTLISAPVSATSQRPSRFNRRLTTS